MSHALIAVFLSGAVVFSAIAVALAVANIRHERKDAA